MIASAQTAISTELLRGLGNVPNTYRHEWRVVSPAEPLVLPRAIFKWYHVHREGVPVAPNLDAEAREIVADALTTTPWDPSYGLNIATNSALCRAAVDV